MVEVKCAVCQKPFKVKSSRLAKIKNGITCSRECSKKLRSIYMTGEKNHQFGLKGEKNSSFKNVRRVNSHGYVTVYKPEHPFCNGAGRVLEHRLIVEANADKFDRKYFLELDGKLYLRKEFSVHHKNEIHNDNRIDNLVIVTRSEHTKIHNSEKRIIRDRRGRILHFIKNGEPIPIGIKLFRNGKVPILKTVGSVCFDCYANDNVIIKSGERAKVGLGFGLELPRFFEALIRPRSGLSLKGVDIALGTIDEDFKAEISVVVINNSGEDFEVMLGDRICQLAIREAPKVNFIVVDELSETERGSNGFGSTGLKG